MPGSKVSGPGRAFAQEEISPLAPGVSGVILHPMEKVEGEHARKSEALVVEEVPLTLFVNDQETATMLCSPGDEEHLVLGFLASEGFIASARDVRGFSFDKRNGIAWAETASQAQAPDAGLLRRCLSACCGRGRAEVYFANDSRLVRRLESTLRLPRTDIPRYMDTLAELSETFRVTGGVHNGALFAHGAPVCFKQDIGRHNVLDKLYGYCLANAVAMEQCVLAFSGRVSSEIVIKLSKMRIPIVAARSAPTSLALELGDALGVTVIGFAKQGRCNVYTHAHRIWEKSQP